MQRQVLVLNQDYQAISLCEPERALVLVMMQKAEMIADVAERRLRSVKQEFEFPSIIRLLAYVRLPFKKVHLTRHNVMKRDGYACAYCGSTKNLTLDHVLPRAQGGQTSWNNLITACYSCNSQKGDRTPEQARMPLLRKPYRPSFIMYLSQFSGDVHAPWRPFLYMD